MIATRSDSASASSIECVVSTTARPRLEAAIMSHTMRRDTGSCDESAV